MKLTTLIVCLVCSGCTAEWDTVKVPQRNPMTHRMESKYVYIPAYHQLPPPDVRPTNQQ